MTIDMYSKLKVVKDNGLWVVTGTNNLTDHYETQAEAITEIAQEVVKDQLEWLLECQVEQYGDKIREAAAEYIKSHLVPQSRNVAQEEREINFSGLITYLDGYIDCLKDR